MRRVVALALFALLLVLSVTGMGIAGQFRHAALPTTPTVAPSPVPSAAVPSATAAVPSATAAVPSATGSVIQQDVEPGSTATPASKQAVASAGPARPEYLALFVLDGARPDYLSVPGLTHLQALMRRGTLYDNAFAGILESETPSGHAAIGTGSNPSQDGILSFDWATSDNIPVDLFSPSVVRSGKMEQIMAAAKVPTIAGLVHKRDPGAKVVALSGHKYYAADAIGGPDADVIMYYAGTPDGKFAPTFIPGHGPPAGVLSHPDLTAPTIHLPLGAEDHLAMKLTVDTFERMHEKVTLVNMPEFDWPLGHPDGGDRNPAEVRTLMQGFDRDLGMVEDAYRKAGVLDKTLFVITADHGMAPIYHTVSDTQISKAVTDAGTSIVSSTFHTAAYLWVRDETRAAAAASNIAHLMNPYIQSVYFREADPNGFDYVRASGAELFKTAGQEPANQYLLHSFNGSNAPDLVVFFREEAASLPGGQAQWKGDHGGAAWESQHIPLLIAGPGIRAGVTSAHPARLEDLAPTALSLMGIAPSRMTGIPLSDAMSDPPARAITAQRALDRTLMPVVHAMQEESKREVAAGL